MHWCFNVTASYDGHGAGILIRAAEPLSGIPILQQNRHLQGSTLQKNNLKVLTNGPAKFAQAMAIDSSLYGHDLSKSPLQVYEAENRQFDIITTTRIGISKSQDTLARFYIKDNPYVSKK